MATAKIQTVVSSFKCVLCGLVINATEDPPLLSCGHTFCLKCLETQFLENKSCALCQQNIAADREDNENLRESFASFASKCALESNESKHDNAEFLCVDCWDSLCLSCSRVHTMTKLTKNHIIKTMTDINKEDVDRHKRAQTSQCLKHSNQEYVLYCNHCDELACTICFATSHCNYPCKCIELKIADIQFVTTINKKIIDNDYELRNLSKKVNKVNVPLKTVEKYRANLVSQCAELKQKIQVAYNLIIDDIDNNATIHLVNLDKELTTLTNQCKRDEERVATLRATNVSIKSLLLPSSSVIDRFCYLKQMKEAYINTGGMQASKSTTDSTYHSVFNTGYIERLSQSKVEVQQTNELPLIGTIQDNRLQTEIIFTLALNNNCLFIGRIDSTKLSVYDLDNLKYVRYQHLRDGVQPTDVKFLSNDDIICLSSQSKRVVLMTQDCDFVSETFMKEPVFCYVSTRNNAIYIANSRDGIYQSIDGGISFHHIFSSPDKAHCFGVVAIPSNSNSSEIYWVCESKYEVNFRLREYVRKRERRGKMSLTYTDINIEYFDKNKNAMILVEPNYMAYDGGDFIYVSDSKNDTVHVIDIINKTLRLLLTSDNQLNQPSALAIDEKRRQLFVGQADGQVLIFALDDCRKVYNFKLVL